MSISECPNFIAYINNEEIFSFVDGAETTLEDDIKLICLMYEQESLKPIATWHFKRIKYSIIRVAGYHSGIERVHLVNPDTCNVFFDRSSEVWKSIIHVNEYTILASKQVHGYTYFKIAFNYTRGMHNWYVDIPQSGTSSVDHNTVCGYRYTFSVKTV